MFCGIDIGGTHISVGLVSSDGNIACSETVHTRTVAGAEDIIDVLADIIFRLKKQSGSPLKGIGIGAPGGNYYEGTMVSPSNMKIKGIVPVVALFKKKFPDVPVYITNDANAAATGEKVYGAGKELTDFVVITLGTGLGSGFIVNGQIMYGANGMAGELGHTIAVEGGRQCKCGRRGCLERYVAAEGILITYREVCSEMGVVPSANTAEDIYSLAVKDDGPAKETFLRTGNTLGASLATMAMITAPSHIILFGGITNGGEYLLSPTRNSFEEHLLESFRNSIIIQRSAI